jgi:hypothetical protein
MILHETKNTVEIEKSEFEKILLYLYMYNTEVSNKRHASEEVQGLQTLLDDIKVSIK